MTEALYNTLRWRATAARVRRRDGDRCLIDRLLGVGHCSSTLHVHHVTRPDTVDEWYAEENLVTVCAAHHPMLESLRRFLDREPDSTPARRAGGGCQHFHRTEAARRECEAGMAHAGVN